MMMMINLLWIRFGSWLLLAFHHRIIWFFPASHLIQVPRAGLQLQSQLQPLVFLQKMSKALYQDCLGKYCTNLAITWNAVGKAT
jgi:hypothetical protein